MTRASFTIDASNVDTVKNHIRQQFGRLSWWPTEGPAAAKEEFEHQQHSPEALVEWCEKWLDSGQWRKLKKAVKRAAENTQLA